MNLQKLISGLAESGIDLTLAGADLKVNGHRDALTPARISLIKRHKLQLVDFLRSEAEGDTEKFSEEQRPYKEYKFPDGRTLALSREEFQRVVDAVRILIKMDNEQPANSPKGAAPEVA